MADVRITDLTNEQKPEMIDLKVEAEKGNTEAIVAFKSLRGGASKPVWCRCSLK
ncbi:MAG: hypothetical protein ACK5RY_14410 [Dolichospermum sp.]|jgi:hypothetical protein|nr:hypothetical protein [Anabaena sp. 49628_E55]